MRSSTEAANEKKRRSCDVMVAVHSDDVWPREVAVEGGRASRATANDGVATVWQHRRLEQQ